MKSVLKFIGAVALVAFLIPALFYTSLMLWGDWQGKKGDRDNINSNSVLKFTLFLNTLHNNKFI
jgi:hypothetical protein